MTSVDELRLDIKHLDDVLELLRQCPLTPLSFDKWKDFGSALGLDDVTLTDVQLRGNNSSDCMEECLSEWLKKADNVKWYKGVPTLGRLSAALEEIGERSAADYIRRNGSSYIDDLFGESFGQRRPPLYEMIRNILCEYPSGQIFKEIIQNADDARATEVKFFLDCRVLQTLPPSLISAASDSSYSKQLLQQFIGPALLSYNNAPFRKEDWESIQSLQQSGKAKNPHKVGKFGIGFNSVYHITDLPAILSQNYCGFLEPQERVWTGESGKGFFLKSLKNNCQEALEPFDGICGFSKHNPSYQDKTLFRFPLRTRESNLSSDVYTIDKLHSLLHTLQEEAQYLLVFLRSVCSIEICKITESNDTVSLFKVSVSQRDFQSRLSQQRQLLSDVESTFIDDSKYSVRDIIKDTSRFNIEKVDSGIVSDYDWLVVNQIGSDDDELMQLAEKQHVLPWVGTAINLEDLISNGRIFCVLPLPVEDQAPFHVHVNGTFAISSNRRSLKWEAQERKGDEEGTWNKLLVEKCLPSCYFKLVSELMELLIDPNTVYSCWPDIEEVTNTPWQGLLGPFYQLLVNNSKAVHTFGERWVSVSDAVFIIDKLPASVKDAVVSCNENVVEINDSNYEALKQYCSLKTLQPAVVRSYLKSNVYSYCNASRNEKLEILKYILQDDAFQDITGLQLLPLADNSFKMFQNKSCYVEDIFVCSSSHPSSLLPGLENQLVSVYNEDSTLHSLLCSVVKSGCTQLVLLDTEQVANLISKCNTSYWSRDQMSQFWRWLNSQELTHFKWQPIVPVKSHTGGTSVTALAKQNGVVYISRYTRVSLALLSGLEKCSIRFADAHEFSYLKHKQLPQYLYQFENDQVLDAMQPLYLKGVSLSSSEAVAMQQFFSNFELDYNRIATLCKIPLFKALQHNESSRVSVNAIRTSYCDNKAIAMSGTYSFRTDLLTNSPLIIDVTGNFSSLIRNLSSHIYLMQETEYLQKVAFQQIRNRQFINSLIVPFMISVLDNFYSPQYRQAAHQLTSAMSSLPFVEVSNSSTLDTPQNLFDPEIEILHQLYNGENKFPATSFHSYLPILRQCGLKSSVNGNEIFEIVSSLRSRAHYSTSCNVGQIKYSRILSVLKYLFDNPRLFYVSVNYNCLLDALLSQASQYCWLPVASNPPNNYPSNVTWKGSLHSTSLVSNDFNPLVVQTQELASSDLPLIAGSQVLFVENVPSQLAQGLGSQPRDLVPAVIAHFHEIISLKDIIPTDMLQSIALQTYSYLLQNISYCDSQMFLGKWIWSEALSTFIDSSQVAASANPSFRSNLAPFILVLPASLQKFSELFIRCGVPVSITSKQIVSVLHSVRDQACGKLHADDAWLIVKSVLDWIVEDTNRRGEDDILVPVKSDFDYPQLLPIEEVFYTDDEIFCDIANDSDEDYSLIHYKVSHLSSKLGLTPLSDHLGITEDVFDDAGQHEPLTTRLGNILREYKDGLTIIKEMIQNADDAGATEVNILYDTRTHSTKNLIIKGMADSHGPALVVHNNSTFTKEDFVNITKLAGATKANQPLKIGKFGVGFCSVYHITDVPSFVSGEWLYIFDPTLKYLKGAVCNENSPGKKMEYRSKFLARSDQLAPYQGLFGFDSSSKYNGTIFRLPFRTNPSQISSTLYNDELVQQIKDDLQDNASKLLLFLQNVKSITFSTVQDNGDPLCEISIKCNVIESYGIEKRVITVTSLKYKEKIEHWLVSCVKKNLEGDNKLAVASVACKLLKSDNFYHCQSIEGNVFCFLPLSVSSTGLPVHVSANFAVMSNRSGILTSESVKESSYSKEHWNKQLMTTVIPNAYCLLLKKLVEMHFLDELDFFALWPLARCLKAKNPWESLLPVLFRLISQENLFYSSCTGEWLTLFQSQFFPSSLFQISRESDLYLFHEFASMLKLPVVALPKLHLEQLQDMIGINTIINEENFLQIFFNSIELFDKQNFSTRNNILFIILSALGTGKYDWLEPLLENIQCIPVSPDGLQLKQVSQLVDPLSFCNMFDPENGMFPLDSFYKNNLVLVAMLKLGLMVRDISWDAIIISAQTIKELYNSDKGKALLRVKSIIKSSINVTNCPVELREIPFLPVLEKPETYILPWKGDGCTVLPPSEVIAMTSEDNMWKTSFIVGSQKPIVNIQSVDKNGCDSIPFYSIGLLNISTQPSLNDVLSHFQCLIDLMSKESSQKFFRMKNVLSHIETICRLVYEFLEIELTNTSHIIQENIDMQPTATEEILHSYQDKLFIWTGSKFVTPSNVAQNWKTNGPYLYKLPTMISERKRLQKALAIHNDFDINKLLDALGQMYAQFRQEPLPSDYHEFINTLILELNGAKGKFDDRIEIILVDDNYVLRPSTYLYYNDVSWISAVDDHLYLMHKNLTTSKAESFGIKPMRSSYLDQFDNTSAFAGLEFGQTEQLTDRLKAILRDYPFDITFLKELLQNADDAKASQMRVILDKRQHEKERVPSVKWGEELQGPGLLVWNDKDFSDEDLKGIQKLGLGSKRDDDESIGQFGIGFNVVYHVTDCPSFITRGDTLCVFDPHCRYVPGANATRPGRQYSTNDKFWNDMSDLHSSFLQDDILNKLPGLDKGVLFRFPLRCIKKQIMESDLIHDKVKTKPLNADIIEPLLNEWVGKIKHSLLFLNNVVNFEYFIIDDTNSVSCKQSFATRLSENSQHKRVSFKNNLSTFRDSKQPFLVMYPLILETVNPETSTEEQWLIQQGVGDVQNCSRQWNYIKKILPRHGIAATLERCNDFKGQVFCFLPLGCTNLPVHINGQFILSSDRHSLWISEPEEPDDKTKWNNNLLESISSSYAEFLEQVKPYFTASQGYKNISSFYNAVKSYYSLFPFWKPPFHFQKKVEVSIIQPPKKSVNDWNQIGYNVLKLLWFLNSEMLASLRKETHIFYVDWHVLHNDKEPIEQAYFITNSAIREILLKLGMVLTCAPFVLFKHLKEILESDDDANEEPAIVTDKSVFQFYRNFHSQIITKCPCSIQDTPFESVKNFIKFFNYMLQKCDDGEEIEYKFSDSPVNIPLLLTADGKLQLFSDSPNTLVSKFFQLFPNSQSQFLHESLISLCPKLTRSYFLSPKSVTFTFVDDLLRENISLQLLSLQVDNSNSLVIGLATLWLDEILLTQEELISLWQCLSTDDTFKLHQANVVEKWALIPSTSGLYFNASSPIRPIIKSPNEAHDVEFYDMLCSFNVPFFDTEIELPSVVEEYCFQLTDADKVLCMLYHIHKQKNIFNCLKSSCPTTFQLLLKYLGRVNFRNDSQSLEYMKSLPVFESIQGDLTCIFGKDVYTVSHDYKVCQAGYSKWATNQNIIFLNPSGLWNSFCDIKVFGIESVDIESAFIRFIFPEFSRLNSEERFQHLSHIKDNNFISERDCDTPSKFYSELCKLPCIEGKDGRLQPVSYFEDHTFPLFNAFQHYFSFVPMNYQEETWLKFFQILGLQKTLNKEKFKTCCKSLSLKNASVVSDMLASYLFSKSAITWHKDSEFLAEIGGICFIKVEPLDNLQWIKMPPESTGLTSLNQAVLHNYAELVWTVKPVVKLPTEYMESYEYKQYLMEASICPAENESYCYMTLKKLGVTIKPEVEDVFRNLVHVSETYLSDPSLFSKYDINITRDQCCLLQSVIIRSFQYLIESSANQFLEHLVSLPCIPVSADNSKNDIVSRPVLVRPIQVVRHIPSDHDSKNLFPYIISLPSFMEEFGNNLFLIGISESISLKALRHLLEKLKDRKLNTNDSIKVREALLKLYNLCKDDSRDKNIITKELSPLYLPNDEGYMKQSTELLFVDLKRYVESHLNLAESSYSLFQLPTVPPSSQHKNISERKICLTLPEEVRPHGLSLVCKEELLLKSDQTSKCPDLIDYFQNLKFLVPSLQSVLPKAILAHLKNIDSPTVDDTEINTEIDKFILTLTNKFISEVKVVVIEDLGCHMKLLADEMLIGTINVPFLFQDSTLYVDSNAKPSSKPFCKDMASIMCVGIARIHNVKLTEYFIFLRPITDCLSAQSNDELSDILDEYDDDADINMISVKKGENIVRGKGISKEIVRGLEMDTNHLFQPEEWVGFEISEGNYVYATILYPIMQNEDNEDINFQRRYIIRVNDLNDEEIRDVSILDLYKLPVYNNKKVSECKELILSSIESKTAEVSRHVKLEELKKLIVSELDRIWMITGQDDKRKAIKRMYLKYHPDRVLPSEADLYEKVFQFLKEQIEVKEFASIEIKDEQPLHYRMAETYFDQWDKFVQETFRSSNRSNLETNQADSHSDLNFDSAFILPQRNSSEADRWLKQAKTDLLAMNILCQYLPDKSVCCQVLFLAHETCEKALKAGMYKLFGLNHDSLTNHYLYTHANAIASSKKIAKLRELPQLVLSMEKYYLDSRFPNRHSLPSAPVDVYSSADAFSAAKDAERVYDLVAMIFEPRETLTEPMTSEQKRKTDIAIQCDLIISQPDEEKLRQELQKKIESLEQQLKVKDHKEVAVQVDYHIPQTEWHYKRFENTCIAGEKEFLLNSDDSSFLEWEEYGFSVFIPKEAVPSSSVKITVTAIVGGNFVLPENTEIVSAVYAISASQPLSKPVMLKIQHCVSLETSDHINSLSFATASDNQPPYQFQKIQGGKFSIGERYGCIFVTEFSLWSIIMKRLKRLGRTSHSRGPTHTGLEDPSISASARLEPVFPSHSKSTTESSLSMENDESTAQFAAVENLPEKLYFGQVMYDTHKPGREWLMKFLLSKDLNALIKYVHNTLKNIRLNSQISFTFDEPSNGFIELSFDTGQDFPGWSIREHQTPTKVSQKIIDQYGSLCPPRFPECLITITFTPGSDTLTELNYPVELKGIKSDFQKINIILTSKAEQLPEAHSPKLSVSSDSQSQYFKDVFRKNSGDLLTELNVNKVKKVIDGVLVSHYAALNSLKTSLSDLASQLYAAHLISDEVRETRSMEKFITEFKASLSFKRKLPQIQEHCQKFLSSFIAVRGSYADAAIALAEDWSEAIRNELEIDFNINTDV